MNIRDNGTGMSNENGNILGNGIKNMRQAEKFLMNGDRQKQFRAISYLSQYVLSGSLQVLEAALMRFKDDEELAANIMRASVVFFIVKPS